MTITTTRARPRLNWAFAEMCERAQDIEDLRDLLIAETQRLGFIHVACCDHVNLYRPPPTAIVLQNYPTPWLILHSSENYLDIDPVFETARRQITPFQWSDPRFREPLRPVQLRILEEAKEAGLRDAITIPMPSNRGPPASCSLVLGPNLIDATAAAFEAHRYALHVYQAAKRFVAPAHTSPALGLRERQCVMLAARGKEDGAIAQILGVSESTAHNTIERVKRKYRVATRQQAIIRALLMGEFNVEDVAG